MQYETENIYIEIGRTLGRLFLKVFQFSLYLSVTFLQLIINLLKALFLSGYEPFKPLKEGKDGLLEKAANKKINEYKIQFASDFLSRHEYNFNRSLQYKAQYKYLQDKLKEIADNKITLNDAVYKDIFKRISILVSEAERQALQEGYNHARKTHYSLYGDEISEDFIRDKVLSGQSNTDWGDLKLKEDNKNG